MFKGKIYIINNLICFVLLVLAMLLHVSSSVVSMFGLVLIFVDSFYCNLIDSLNMDRKAACMNYLNT